MLPVAAFSFAPDAHAYTNINGININEAIGADAFYQNGIYGQNASVANIEAGHFWIGHDSLNWVSASHLYDGVDAITPGPYQDHATSVAQTIAGREGNANDILISSSNASWGIAPGVDLYSGNIATSFGANGSFDTTEDSFISTYSQYFGSVDVINSSWGATDENGLYQATSWDFQAQVIDTLAGQNTHTTMVVAAGNSGSAGSNSVGSPAVAFNVISVGALNTSLNGVASFSSYGPSDFYYGETYAGVRSTVDIIAPGSLLNLATYDSDSPAATDYAYSSGTSFAAPTVAGTVALLYSQSHTTGMSEDSRDARVIKAVLLNSADKISGWSNGTVSMDAVERDNGTSVQSYDNVLVTTQALDYQMGSGALNADAAYNQYTQNSTATGWVLDQVTVGSAYEMDAVTVAASTTLTVTLTWFVQNVVDLDSLNIDQYALSDLDLEIWTATPNGSIDQLLALSATSLDNVEHLQITFDEETKFVIRVVNYDPNAFDFLDNASDTETFALAWNIVGTIIPEPSTYALFGGGILLSLIALRRRKKQS